MKSFFNKLISLSSCFVFALSLLTGSANAQSMTRAVSLITDNGEKVGYAVTADAAEQVQAKLNETVKTGSIQLKSKYEIVPLSAVSDTDSIYQNAISAQSANYISAYGLYVNGTLCVAAERRSDITDAVNDLTESVRESLGADMAEITDAIEIEEGLFGFSYIDCNAYDTVSSMSFSMQAVKYRTVESEIDYKFETVEDPTHETGYEKTVGGEKGIMQTVYCTRYINGVQTAETELSSTVIKEPVNRQLIIGTAPKSAQIVLKAASGSTQGSEEQSSSEKSEGMVWPVNKDGSNSYVSCGYMGYSGHTGVDIAAYAGTAVYAVRGGTVMLAGYHPSYGYQIIIDHSDGTQTRYAHCNELFVSVGQTVGQGQNIATVGQTGNATGPHLHFEVLINGSAVNPRPYLGY